MILDVSQYFIICLKLLRYCSVHSIINVLTGIDVMIQITILYFFFVVSLEKYIPSLILFFLKVKLDSAHHCHATKNLVCNELQSFRSITRGMSDPNVFLVMDPHVAVWSVDWRHDHSSCLFLFCSPGKSNQFIIEAYGYLFMVKLHLFTELESSMSLLRRLL